MNIYKIELTADAYIGSKKGKEKEYLDSSVDEVTVAAKNHHSAIKKAIQKTCKEYSYVDDDKDSDTYKQRRYVAYTDIDVIKLERTASDILG